MNKSILNTGVQDFINKNINTDTSSVLLKGVPFEKVSAKEIVAQIEAKKKCKKKLPNWYHAADIYFPSKLSIEQSSSEITASYKASLISGESLLDLTGGFGVDSYFFSNSFKQVIHCEIDQNLSEIVRHNFQVLNKKNIAIKNTDGLDFLTKNASHFDWVFIDPSRRNTAKEKVFMLKDCLPDVPRHLDLLFQHTDQILIKTSPVLDISIGIKELKSIAEIHIVAVNNEVKELLWVLKKEWNIPLKIKTINIKKEENELFKFIYGREKNITANYSSPLNYLYEPNAAILKSGAFQLLAKELNVFKLHKHSHLYTSKNLITFPGRSFKIENVQSYNKKKLKSQLAKTRGNIAIRNFPESVKTLRQLLKIEDGGDSYYFFTTDMNNQKILISCKKAS